MCAHAQALAESALLQPKNLLALHSALAPFCAVSIVLNNHAKATFEHCTFSQSDGTALRASTASAKLVACTFHSCIGVAVAAAAAGKAELTNCAFMNCEFSAAAWLQGKLVLAKCTVSKCTQHAVYITGKRSSVCLTDCQIDGDPAQGCRSTKQRMPCSSGALWLTTACS